MQSTIKKGQRNSGKKKKKKNLQPKSRGTWMLWIEVSVIAQNWEQVSEVPQAVNVTQRSNRISYLTALTVSVQTSEDYKAWVMLSKSRKVQLC